MICDKLGNLKKYLPKAEGEMIMKFVTSTSQDTPEGRYRIKDDDIFARVMSYTTKNISTCEMETHEEFVDIHFSLSGEEIIEISPKETLDVERKDVVNDAIFYTGCDFPMIKVSNKTGFFTMLFSEDAHRTQGIQNELGCIVKKCVIKVKNSYLRSSQDSDAI